MDIIQKPTPNFWPGRAGQKPEAVVIHIMAGTLVGTDAWFANPVSQVSAHYGLGRAGEVHQYVKEADTAFHAGVVKLPSWKLLKPGVNPNRYTIGIEHEGQSSDIWTDVMKKTSAELVRAICGRWGIPIDRDHVIGHYEIDSIRRPNCPAINKAIIDEIIKLAKGISLMQEVIPIETFIDGNLTLGLLCKFKVGNWRQEAQILYARDMTEWMQMCAANGIDLNAPRIKI